MIIMTFGVNTLDWTNIGRKLQTRLAETFRNETVGDACTACTAESSVLTPFAYYDGATGTVLTTYSAYLDTTSNPPDIITLKSSSDGTANVIDVTPLTLLYEAIDANDNRIITSDSSAEGVQYDEQGEAIPLAFGDAEFINLLKVSYDAAINTDTVWAPDHMLTLDSATTGDSYQEVESVANSDTTAWVRLRARNGLESIYFSIPTANMAEQADYESFLDTLPETFTFDDNTFFYPHGTVVELDTPATAAASTVEATSLASTKLSSTYETTLTDLNTDYEAVLSGTYVGGGSGGTSGSTDCPDNATYNTTDAKCKCDDGYKPKMTTDGSGTLLECNVTFMHNFYTTTWPNGKVFILDNKFWIIGGGFVLLGGLGWVSGLFRGSRVKEKTLGQLLDKAVGSGKELSA
tara:strand:- start:528 stop:1745 length:1218 start_codon:yes stop_codon:yes gene_type:complete